MRKLTSIFAALVCALFMAMPASAQVLDVNVDGLLDEVLVGVNGVVTAPLDVVMGVVEGDNTYKLPALGAAGDWVVGLSSGVISSAVRAGTGVADVALAPVAWLLDNAGNPLGVEFGNPFSPPARFVVVGPDTRASE